MSGSTEEGPGDRSGRIDDVSQVCGGRDRPAGTGTGLQPGGGNRRQPKGKSHVEEENR